MKKENDKSAKLHDYEQQILDGTRKAGKDYHFDNDHDPIQPAEYWFENSREGLTLFVVFYTQACRWSRCVGCSLPSKMSLKHIDFKQLMGQVDTLFNTSEIKRRYPEIRKVIISNNGSVLDEVTFSSTALIYLFAKLNMHLTHLSVVALESRPEFVDLEELAFLQRTLKEGESQSTIELCVGFEAFNDRIRNEVFDKGLTLETFEAFVQKVARYGFRIKCYFMQKPVPGMSDESAVNDIKGAIDYLSEIAGRYRIDINIHLNPTFVAKGTALEGAFKQGSYVPPRLIDIAKSAYHARNKGLSLFIGLSDEDLAVEGGSFLRPGDEKLKTVLDDFNRNNDYTLLEPLFKKIDATP